MSTGEPFNPSPEPGPTPGPTPGPDPAAGVSPGPTGPYCEAPQLRRPFYDRMITGTAAGLGQYLGIDPTIVRVIFVALLIFGGAGLPLYAAAWLLIPEEGAQQSVAMDLLDHARGLFGSPSQA
jgi:phage shock protein PspC (stress-responsive transcriptional regulator)